MFKKLNLKWRISLFTSLLIFIILLIVFYIIVNFTGSILNNQINKNITIITESSSNTLNNLLNRIESEIRYFTQSEEIYNFTNLLNTTIKNEVKNEKDFKGIEKRYAFMIEKQNDTLKKPVKTL